MKVGGIRDLYQKIKKLKKRFSYKTRVILVVNHPLLGVTYALT